MKKCRICGFQKQSIEFYKNQKTKDGLFNECKTCTAIIHKKWAIANRKKLTKIQRIYRLSQDQNILKASRKKYYQENKTILNIKRRKTHYQKAYNLTIEQYESMIASQLGLCAICGLLPSGKGNGSKLHVDHDHTTGKVRALLCNACNQTLGKIKESIEILEKMKNYLIKYKSK